MNIIAAKVHKCRSCRLPYDRLTSFQTRCVKCLAKLGRANLRRDRTVEKRAALARLMTRGDHMRLAQEAFNRYIRLRDADLPCISCQRFHKGKWNAGHYRAVGACPELRFNEANVHKQCEPCNSFKSGNVVEYRINLVIRIGADQVQWLEGPHQPMKLTVDQIKAIRTEYLGKAKALEKSNELRIAA